MNSGFAAGQKRKTSHRAFHVRFSPNSGLGGRFVPQADILVPVNC
jgi:hypothetical protein